VTITQVSGTDFTEEKVCPPPGYTGKCPELATLTPAIKKCTDFNSFDTCSDLAAVQHCTSFGDLSTCEELDRRFPGCFKELWKPDQQDIFLTFTKVDMLTDQGDSGKSGNSSTSTALLILGLLCCCCCCCGCSYYWYSQNKEQNSARTPDIHEAELQAYPPSAQPWVQNQPVVSPVVPVVQATPVVPVAPAVGPVGYVQPGQAYSTAQASTVAEPPPPPSTRKCFQGHPLGGYTHSYAEPAECDRCGASIFSGHVAYGCRACDYDLCQECYSLDTFLDFPAYRGGATWRQELEPHPPMQTGDGILAPPWSDAMLHAVAWELNNPQWPSDLRFSGARNGPAGQIIDFLIGKGFEYLQPIAENTEQWAKDSTGLSEIQRMYDAGYQPQDHQLPLDPTQLRRMLGHNGLKQELQQRGLKHTGKTEDLAVRLSEALARERQ